MDRRGFLRIAGLAPLALVAGPMVGRGATMESRPPPTTEREVRERLAEIEREVGVGIDGDTAICRANGRPYRTVAWSREGIPVKKEGHRAFPVPTKEAAWALWYVAFKEYRGSRRGKIHWRRRPTIQECFSGGETWDTINDKRVFDGYLVYARLVIDD